jgi:hypothetical protein
MKKPWPDSCINRLIVQNKTGEHISLKTYIIHDGFLGAITSRAVGMYAYQTLNQNAIERRSSLKIPQMKELAFGVFVAKKVFKDETK